MRKFLEGFLVFTLVITPAMAEFAHVVTSPTIPRGVHRRVYSHRVTRHWHNTRRRHSEVDHFKTGSRPLKYIKLPGIGERPVTNFCTNYDDEVNQLKRFDAISIIEGDD